MIVKISVTGVFILDINKFKFKMLCSNLLCLAQVFQALLIVEVNQLV